MPPRPFRFFQFPWRSRAAIARDVDAELEFHIDARINALRAQGLGADEARRRACEEFGDLELTRRYCRTLDERAERTTRLTDRVTEWAQDARYAARAIRRSPGFAAVSIATLTLAIGANTAIFSVARAVLLKPLPYAKPSELVVMYESPVETPSDRFQVSVPNLVDYRIRQHSLTGIAGYMSDLATWRPEGGDPEILETITATVNLFDVLGVAAWRGRALRPGDDAPGSAARAVLSYRFWQRAFGGDTTAVGRTIILNNQPFYVVGVMPRGFTVTGHEDVWTPMDLRDYLARAAITRKQHWIRTIARLRPGISIAGAGADVLGIGRLLQREYPEADAGYLPALVPLHETMAGNVERPVLLLLGAAFLVLAIACANLANLALSRAIDRRAELAVRAALGAGWGRLARQLLTESTLLALIGGGLGVLLAEVATKTLLSLNPNALPSMFEVGVDGRVVAFSVLLSVGTGILFGLVPVLAATRTDLHGSLKERGRGGSGGRGGERARRVLVVAQVALAVVLLVGAGLLIRSFGELTRVQLGFDPDRVLTAQVRVDGARYDSSSAVNQFYDGVLADIARTPGVVAVGAAVLLPTQGNWGTSIVVEGSAADPTRLPGVGHTMVRGSYFAAMRIPILAGRAFNEADPPDGPKTAMLNGAAARRFFPDGVAVGRRIRIGPNPTAPWRTIVGVAGDSRDGVDQPASPLVFLDSRQETWWHTFSLIVRTAGDPETAAPIIQRAVKTADPTLAIRDVATLDQVIGSSLATRRFGLGLAASFAGLALLLAAVGIYGVLAYSVTSRTREFGVRLALGAPTRSVLVLVLRQGLAWSLVGLGFGIGGAVAGGRLLAGMLYGIEPLDLRTYLAVGAGLLVVVTAACLVPAARATGVDPLTSTRAE